MNTRIYNTATEAFNELQLPAPVRRELREKIIAWADEYQKYIEKKNAK